MRRARRDEDGPAHVGWGFLRSELGRPFLAPGIVRNRGARDGVTPKGIEDELKFVRKPRREDGFGGVLERTGWKGGSSVQVSGLTVPRSAASASESAAARC